MGEGGAVALMVKVWILDQGPHPSWSYCAVFFGKTLSKQEYEFMDVSELLTKC